MVGGNSKDAAVAAVEEASRQPPGRLVLRNGIVLAFRPVPPYLVRQAAANVERPKPPRVLIEEKGREEENPNDPAYIEALLRHTQDSIDAANNVILLAGTEIEAVPDGMFRPEDDGWVEVVAYLGIEVSPKDNKYGRYLDWLHYYALTADDLRNVWEAQKNNIGLTEEEVAEGASSFRNRAQRRRDKRLPSKAAEQRDNVSTPSA